MTDDDVRMRALLGAAESGDVGLIKEYLATKPPVAECGYLPLVRAVAFKQQEIVEMIVGYAGKEVFKQAPHVMEIAYRNSDWQMAKYLVAQGAEPRFRTGVGLFHILNDAPMDLIKTLIDAEDAETKARYKNSLFMLTLARHAGKQMEGREDLLEWALSQSRLDEYTKRQFFYSTVEMAPHFLPLLKKHGVYFDTDIDYGTPLLRAVENKSARAVKGLLDCGADPTGGWPSLPLAIAVSQGSLDIVELLVNGGADLYARNGAALTLARNKPENAEILHVLEKAFSAQEKAHKQVFDSSAREDFLQAAKAGAFPKLAKDFAAAGKKMNAVDVTRIPDWQQPYLMGVLEFRGELKSLLDYKLWNNPQADFSLLCSTVTPNNRASFAAAMELELQKMHADADMDKLRRGKDGCGKFKL